MPTYKNSSWRIPVNSILRGKGRYLSQQCTKLLGTSHVSPKFFFPLVWRGRYYYTILHKLDQKASEMMFHAFPIGLLLLKLWSPECSWSQRRGTIGPEGLDPNLPFQTCLFHSTIAEPLSQPRTLWVTSHKDIPDPYVTGPCVLTSLCLLHVLFVTSLPQKPLIPPSKPLKPHLLSKSISLFWCL